MYCPCEAVPQKPEFAMKQVAPLLAPDIYWCCFCGRLKTKRGWEIPKITFDTEQAKENHQ